MSEHTQHIDSIRTYTIIFLLLIVLTFVTTGVAYIDLGVFSIAVALAIAVVKMLLVALWFMHVRHSSRLTKLTVGGGLLWLVILITFTASDIVSRGWLGTAR